MQKNNNYVPYHVHSYYSLLDSCTSPEEYCKKAFELGMKAFCWTEHSNLFNWYQKKKLCDQYGLKYLHGIECYITESLEEKVKDNWHTVLIAKNQKGFEEINNLFFLSYQKDHFYYKPRITVDEFLAISDNVIKISACIQSPLWQFRKSILAEEIKNRDRMKKYIQMCKHYDYYEIQYHSFLDNLEYTKYLWELSKRFGKSLIVGTDTHSLNQYKAECRTILQYGKTEGAWGDSENECDLTFKSYNELIEKFCEQGVLPEDVYLQAIENTNVMADSCEELIFDTHDKYPFLYGDRDEEIMWSKIKRNYKEKRNAGIISNDMAYVNQIKEEMAVFKKVNMVGFMLFMAEMMTWVRESHIATGFSRGSVSGSVVAYITNITDVNPLKWNTIFSRFCNEHRVEAGDIDIDVYDDDRPKVYDYIINRFGVKKTAYILALGTLAEKNTIAVICKALRNKDKNSPYTLEKMEYIKAEYNDDPEGTKAKYPEVFYYFDGLVNCVVSQSQHPAGIVAAPMNLIDYCGAFLGSDGQQILPLDMDMCHALGLIKYDILGLKTIGVVDKICKMIGQHFPKAHEIDFTDQAVYDDMAKDPLTIFQFESQYAQECFKKMNCRSIDDITLVNAALRPGGASYRDRLFNHEVNDNGSELINDVLKESYGYLSYQEEVTAFLQYVCGFSGSDADSVRRCIDEDSLILMGDGNLKAIKNIQNGDYVQSFNQYNVSEPQRVLNVFDNGIQDTYCLISNNGYQLIATDSHKILTQDGYKTVHDLTTDDYIMTPKKINAITDGLKSNKHLSESTMFLIGLLLGDGCIIKQNQIHFTNHEEVLIEKFKECVNDLSRTKRNDCQFKINKQKGVTVDYIYSVYIISCRYKTMLNRLLSKYDLLHRAKNKAIPDALMMYPVGTKLINLIAGLFNTDGGYVSQGNYIEYYSTSHILVQQIKSLLAKFGIYSYIQEKYVPEYNYMCYSIVIRQKQSLILFKNHILPYIIGKKHNDFLTVINNTIANEDMYDYLLPQKCRDEIIKMSNECNISFNSIQGGLKVDNSIRYKQLTNIKAQKIIQYICCPYTYQLLFAEYEPMQIKEIKYCGRRHVYDIEVEKNHNYIANGIIVHNCIAKKDADKIAKALPQILEGYCSKSDKPREIAEEEAKKFLQVIEDASAYMFNKNHALGYSLLSYLCGYYRHYYPVQYCTAYLSCAKNDDDLFNGQQLARNLGIKFENVKFRFAQWDYSYDVDKKIIYKGLSEVPRMSKAAYKGLSSLYFTEFATFNDLLKAMSEVKVNVAQIENLIKLNYFSEFGDINYLLAYLDLFKKYQNRKKRYELIEEGIALMPLGTTSVYDMIQYEYDVNNMISMVYSSISEKYFFVSDIKGTKYTLYQIATGKTSTLRIRKSLTNQAPINVADIIEVDEVRKEGKWKQDANGKWSQDSNNLEDVVRKYTILHQNKN